MKLIRFLDPAGRVTWGVPVPDTDEPSPSAPDGRAIPLPSWRPFDAACMSLPQELGQARQVGIEPVPVTRLLPPIDPPAIFGIGLNYRAHAAEQGLQPPERPVIFMKNICAVSGPFDAIVIPRVCQDRPQVDFECELAIVIGRAARDVPESVAMEFVFGFTAANDVSARWWQKSGSGGQFVRGKSFDTFCPLGPAITTADEIANPDALRVMTRLNGEIMQDSNTSDMIFPVRKLVSFLSEGTTLLPGTVILTGTPSGVGFARNPAIFLKEGDVVEVGVERIGVLRNVVTLQR